MPVPDDMGLVVACEDGVQRAWTPSPHTRVGTLPWQSYARPTRTALGYRVRGILVCGLALIGLGDVVLTLVYALWP